MSIFGTAFLCFIFFMLGSSAFAYVCVPDKFPVNWWDLAGWVLFAVAIICFDIARA